MERTTTEARRTRVFKRYPNRKFYDTSESRYVNLDEIAMVIKTGTEVKVLDNGTMRDLTGITLARILSWEEKKTSKTCPRTLSALIRWRGAGAEQPLEHSEAQAGLELDARQDTPEHLVHALLNRGHRAAWRAKVMLSASMSALDRLDDKTRQRLEGASEVVASLAKMKRQLSRMSRQIGDLYEQLRDLDAS